MRFSADLILKNIRYTFLKKQEDETFSSFYSRVIRFHFSTFYWSKKVRKKGPSQGLRNTIFFTLAETENVSDLSAGYELPPFLTISAALQVYCITEAPFISALSFHIAFRLSRYRENGIIRI